MHAPSYHGDNAAGKAAQRSPRSYNTCRYYPATRFVRQACRHTDALLVHSYEKMADDIDGQLDRFFQFIGGAPMTLAELHSYFDQEWHFIGNRSLLNFDGLIRRSQIWLPRAQERLICANAGVGV